MATDLERYKNSDGAVQIVSLPVSSPAVRIVGDNRRRLALVFSPPATGSFTISTDQGVTPGNGINLTAGCNPFEICVERHGGAAMRPWYAIASTGSPVTIAFFEVVSLD